MIVLGWRVVGFRKFRFIHGTIILAFEWKVRFWEGEGVLHVHVVFGWRNVATMEFTTFEAACSWAGFYDVFWWCLRSGSVRSVRCSSDGRRCGSGWRWRKFWRWCLWVMPFDVGVAEPIVIKFSRRLETTWRPRQCTGRKWSTATFERRWKEATRLLLSNALDGCVGWLK